MVRLTLTLLAGSGLIASTAPQAPTYEDIVKRVAHAFDKGTDQALRGSLLGKNDPASKFGVALIDYYGVRLASQHNSGYRVTPKQLPDVIARIKECVANDSKSAYPLALYAWYVEKFREKGLEQPKTELVEYVEVRASDGRVYRAPVERVIADPAKDARVAELIKRAKSIDSANPLALYLSAAKEESPIVSARGLWKAVGEPGQYVWEVDALWRIAVRDPENKESVARVQKRIEALRRLVGMDSVRLKAYGF